jgi:hypothetical protein
LSTVCAAVSCRWPPPVRYSLASLHVISSIEMLAAQFGHSRLLVG